MNGGGGRETSIVITRAIYTTATNCGPPVACGRFIVLSIREWGGTRHVGQRSDIPADGGGGVEVTNATSTHDIHSCEFHSVTTSTPNSDFHFHYFLLYSPSTNTAFLCGRPDRPPASSRRLLSRSKTGWQPRCRRGVQNSPVSPPPTVISVL